MAYAPLFHEVHSDLFLSLCRIINAIAAGERMTRADILQQLPNLDWGSLERANELIDTIFLFQPDGSACLFLDKSIAPRATMAELIWLRAMLEDPGFLDHVANKKADVVRMYLPPDANCLLSCFDHCIKSRNYVNVIVASKHPRQQWLTMEQAVKHCTQGIGIWEWASNDQGQEPDVVMACCGDTPTLETLAAVTILRRELPELKIRVVNVVDLMKLQPHTEHPHGLTDAEYDTLFTKDKPIIFAYHGYPTLIHELTYRRHNRNLHVRGYKEEGTITTPFDMRVLNDIDRFDLVIDTVQRLPQLGNRGAYLIQKMNDKLVEHRQYIKDNGVDLPEVRAWKWNDGKGVEV